MVETPSSASTEKQEVLAALQKALTGLSEEFRAPIILHYLEGQTQQQVGKIIGISQSRVSRRIELGLEAIRQKLAVMGVAMPAVALTGLLSDPGLLCAPASMLDKLQSAFHASQSGTAVNVSSRIAIQKSRTLFWPWLGGSLAAVVVLSGSYFIWSKPIVSNPGVRSEAPAVVPARALTTATASVSKVWDFNTPEQARDFTVIEGSWHFVPNGGPDGSGCMETDDQYFSARINLKQLKFPVEIKHADQALLPQMAGDHLAIVGFSNDKLRWAGRFHNVGTMLRNTPGQIKWAENLAYVGDTFMDLWVNGQRSSFMAYELAGEGNLILIFRGKHRVDNLTFREINPKDIPDQTIYWAALNRIPLEKRSGKVIIPELKSLRPPNPVYIEFLSHDESAEAPKSPSR